jgi:transposase-like protein
MEYPKNQMEFEKFFSTDEQCLKYLISLRIENGYVCPSCSDTEYWINERNQMVCKLCKRQTSILAGTIFHGTKTPITVILRALWFIVAQKNGISAVSVQKILGIKRYETVWTWLHKFRRLMVMPERTKLSGKVEIDESLVGGKRSGKRGRGAEGKILVIIAIELVGKKMGRVRMETIESADRVQINQFVKNNIVVGSTIITDGWKGYTDVKKMKYKHEIQDKKIILDKEEITPNVHKIASLLKRWLLGTHQNYVSQDYLNFYLDEFSFRYNRRNSKSRGLLFFTLLKQAMSHQPVSKINLFKIQ